MLVRAQGRLAAAAKLLRGEAMPPRLPCSSKQDVTAKQSQSKVAPAVCKGHAQLVVCTLVLIPNKTRIICKFGPVKNTSIVQHLLGSLAQPVTFPEKQLCKLQISWIQHYWTTLTVQLATSQPGHKRSTVSAPFISIWLWPLALLLYRCEFIALSCSCAVMARCEERGFGRPAYIWGQLVLYQWEVRLRRVMYTQYTVYIVCYNLCRAFRSYLCALFLALI